VRGDNRDHGLQHASGILVCESTWDELTMRKTVLDASLVYCERHGWQHYGNRLHLSTLDRGVAILSLAESTGHE
jgi:hypothetical protein